jgi:hypothetical protein
MQNLTTTTDKERVALDHVISTLETFYQQERERQLNEEAQLREKAEVEDGKRALRTKKAWETYKGDIRDQLQGEASRRREELDWNRKEEIKITQMMKA